MKPRLRLVVDNTRPPPPPTWVETHLEALVERTLYYMRNDRRSRTEKEAMVRAYFLSDED